MPALLSAEWFELQRAATADLPLRPGASAAIQFDVSGGPDGPAMFHQVIEDGRIVASGNGSVDDADFTMAMRWDDFTESLQGRFDPVVGFMQGQVKVTGNIGRMLSVLPVTGSDEWREAMAALAEATDAA